MLDNLSAMQRLAIGLVLTLLAAGVNYPARAQDNADLSALSSRIDRLETDLNALQRQVYRGAPPPSGVTAPSGPGALNIEERLSNLEDQMRQLTGRIEELSNNIDQISGRLDKLSSDVDLRLSALEHGGAAPSATSGAMPPRGGTPPGTLGQLPAAPPAGAQPVAAAPQSDLPQGSSQDQYNYAFGLLRRGDFPGAEQAFRAYIAKYPKDPLAGNAQYWIGETYYARKDWNNASIAFAEAYQKYPKNNKAPDDLLKLGMSLGNLGQKANACSAFARLERDFPAAAGNIKERAIAEKQRLGC
jgi:tol-pal system protein YbgF